MLSKHEVEEEEDLAKDECKAAVLEVKTGSHGPGASVILVFNCPSLGSDLRPFILQSTFLGYLPSLTLLMGSLGRHVQNNAIISVKGEI